MVSCASEILEKKEIVAEVRCEEILERPEELAWWELGKCSREEKSQCEGPEVETAARLTRLAWGVYYS